MLVNKKEVMYLQDKITRYYGRLNAVGREPRKMFSPPMYRSFYCYALGERKYLKLFHFNIVL